MNTDDFAIPCEGLHNPCVTPLWTPCTQLKNKQLQPHEFR
jgi:hypothetical protein